MAVKRFLLFFLLLSLLLTACQSATVMSPTATPSVTIPPSAAPTTTPTPRPVPSSTRVPSSTPGTPWAIELPAQSAQLLEIVQSAPPVGMAYIFGAVLFGENPINDSSEVQPRFWIRDENTGNVADYQVVYDPLTAEYLVSLPKGKFGISATIRHTDVYPLPGDFTTFTQVLVDDPDKQKVIIHDLYLMQIMHLTSPVDNNFPIEDYRTHLPLSPDAVIFTWEPIPEAAEYWLTIDEFEISGNTIKNVQSMIDIRLTDTTYKAELPASADGHFYLMRLLAFDQNNNHVGQLMLRDSVRSFGWDFRFIVK